MNGLLTYKYQQLLVVPGVTIEAKPLQELSDIADDIVKKTDKVYSTLNAMHTDISEAKQANQDAEKAVEDDDPEAAIEEIKRERERLARIEEAAVAAKEAGLEAHKDGRRADKWTDKFGGDVLKPK
jgi:type II secretory pathway component HofQ